MHNKGYTTGTCAAAAAGAAAALLVGQPAPAEIGVELPGGKTVRLPVLEAERDSKGALASVGKPHSDDPDVTAGIVITARVEHSDTSGISFAAGQGVGVVTKPGLQVPPGEPAINPVPRRMIERAVRQVAGSSGLRVTVSASDGAELAEKTFNPRLGIKGGISILGTTGLVRPMSAEALHDSLVCALDVAGACGIKCPVLVPGNIGERAARTHFNLCEEQVVQVSNLWGRMLESALRRGFRRILAAGHPGKLAKLAAGEWNTHSSRSGSAMSVVARIARHELAIECPESATTDGIFKKLTLEERSRLAEAVALGVRGKINDRFGNAIDISVVLVGMNCELLGSSGDLSPWK